MPVLTAIDCGKAEAVPPTQTATIIAVVRERCRARNLNFAQADIAVKVALDNWMLTNKMWVAIDAGQRKADALAEKPFVHPWKTAHRHDDTQPPRTAA
jgi:hypothetical protein